MIECGGVIEGEAPPNRGGVRRCPNTKGSPLQPPTACKASKNTQMHRRVWGHIGGVYIPGVYKCMGAYECMGGVQRWGHPDTPKYKNMPATKK